jgi:hypothetical protein
MIWVCGKAGYSSVIMVRRDLLIIIFLGLNNLLIGKPGSQDSTFIFPADRIFPVLFLDPLECQINGGSFFLIQKAEDLSLYSLVNLGFNKPVLARQNGSLSWEMNFGAAAFSQFELARKDDGSYLAGLLNTDFKVSGDFSLRKRNNIVRLRFFHVSSHLGDDYIERNPDSAPNDKSVNYEQIDLTYLRTWGQDYWYAGAGGIITKNVFRERFSFQGGGLYNFRKSKPVNLFTSLNLGVFAENEFIPDVRSAFGVSFNRKSESLARIWLEYYNGQLPYSTLDYGRVSWLGLAMWIKVF